MSSDLRAPFAWHLIVRPSWIDSSSAAASLAKQILAYLSEGAPLEVADAKPTHLSVLPVKQKPERAKIADDIGARVAPPKVADDMSFDERFAAVWAGAINSCWGRR